MLTLTIEYKEILLGYITIVGFISYIPQIVRLIKQRSSEDISILTWVFWTTNSALYWLYLYLSEVNKYLLISQLIEVSLITLTMLVALYFRLHVWVKEKVDDKKEEV